MSDCSCVYCKLQHTSSTTLSSNFLNPCKGIERIRDVIEGTDSLIDGLFHTRAALSQKLNHLQSPASVLAPELLALIFKHACVFSFDLSYGMRKTTVLEDDSSEWIGAEDGYRTQFALSAVSSHWRKIMLSTPRLWATIVLDLDCEWRVKHQVAIFCHFLKYSQQLPFALSLRFSLESIEPVLLDNTVDHLIHKNKDRIRWIRLIHPSEVWMTLVPLLPHLTQFYIERCHFEISMSSIPDVTYQLLTVLHLRNIPSGLALKLLSQSPKLVEYTFRAPNSRFRFDDPDLPTEPFSLAYLQVFEWETDNKSQVIDEALCAFVRFPALRTFAWGGEDQSFASPLFNRLPTGLLNLTLSGRYRDPSADLIPDGLSIEHITLSCFHEASTAISNLKERPHSVSWRFPKLVSITIEHSFGGDSFINMVDFLDSRLRKGMTGTFRVEIYSGYGNKWETRPSGLAKFMKGRIGLTEAAAGINLEVVEYESYD